MGDSSERASDRSALLAFVDRHWSELTLRDARSLCVEIVDSLPQAAVGIKTSLTYR
jgi:hypothetical protein